MIYQVKFYKGNYRARQRKANIDQAVCYVEHHFNASSSREADYSLAIVGRNASETSKGWGRLYARLIAEEFNEVSRPGGTRGILVGGYNGRGNANIYYTRMPAILLEPLFGSTPKHAEIIRSESGQERLAKVLAMSIRQNFPNGGLVAFSVGHKYKTSNPSDRGSAIWGGGNEADYAEKVLKKAQVMLERE